MSMRIAGQHAITESILGAGIALLTVDYDWPGIHHGRKGP
jgi:hypothetical protein